MASAVLTFDWLIESGFDSGEYLALDVYNGQTWITDVRRLNGNQSPENSWISETVDLTDYQSNQLLIRFRSSVSRSDEDANVDNVRIEGILAGPPNQPPVAVADSGSADEGASDNIDLATNDSDADDGLDLAGIAIISGPANGSLSVIGDGTVTYTHDGSETTADSFSYTIDDNSGTTSNVATVSITVNPVNDAPTLNAIADLSIQQNAGLQTVSLSGITAGGGETQVLTVTASSNNPTLIPDPTVTYTSAEATGSISFTPGSSVSGTATITVTVTDNGGTANGGVEMFSRTFDVSVSALPTLGFISDPAAIDEDASQQTVSLTGITAGNLESQPLQVTAVSDNTGLIPNPTVTYTSPDETGSLTYTPVANQYGSAVITVTVTDGGPDKNLGTAGDNASVSQTFTVGVDSVNDPPVAYNDSYSVNQNGKLNGSSVLDNDDDSLGGAPGENNVPLTAELVADVKNGELTLYQNGTFTYFPTSGYSGLDSFTYNAKDSLGAVSITAATVSITVNPVQEQATLYFSLESNGTVGDLSVADEDIVAYDGTNFSLLFDGSDVGLGSFDINAFAIISPTEILMSFTGSGTVGDISMDDSDIVKFTATSLGESTAGSFSMYFDGSDVGLTRSGEDIDGVELLANGNLLISTTGSFSGVGASGADEDIFEFTGTTGPSTTGSFSIYFDGSDVGLSTSSSEDVDALGIDSTGNLYLSTTGSFSVSGASGADEDVFVFTRTSLGSFTSGSFDTFFDGSLHGLGDNDVNAIDVSMGPAASAGSVDARRTSGAVVVRGLPRRCGHRVPRST